MINSIIRYLTLACTLALALPVSADFFTDTGASDVMPVR